MQSILKVSLIFFAVSLAGCERENNNHWEVSYSGIYEGYTDLVLTNTEDFSTTEPYMPVSGGTNIIWGESQELLASLFNYDYEKDLLLEIPDSLGSDDFFFENEDIYASLNCEIFYFSSGSQYDGFYRIHKGFIRGKKVNGVWELDFEIYFGGANNSKFMMQSGANY